MLAILEGTDKLDNNAIAFDCSDGEFRSIEASLYQVLVRTTANEPLRIVQQTRGQRGFQAWHAISEVIRSEEHVRQKNMQRSSVASPRRTEQRTLEQFDDILRTFIKEMNKFGSRFGAVRDECSNGNWDGSRRRWRECEQRRRSENHASCVAGCPQRNRQRKMEIFIKGQNWNEKGGKGGKDGGKNSWQEGAAARKEEKGKRRVAKENPEHVGRAARQDTLQFGAEKEETHIFRH